MARKFGEGEMKPRKIVQLVIDPPFDGWGSNLYAVADDGSGWRLERDEWKQLPPLPPIEDPEGEESK